MQVFRSCRKKNERFKNKYNSNGPCTDPWGTPWINPGIKGLLLYIIIIKGYYSLVWKLLGLCSKLEIWYVSTDTYLVSENIAFSARISLILLKSTLICILNNSMRAVLKIFYFCFQFLLDERLLLMKLSIMTHASGIRLAVAQNWP